MSPGFNLKSPAALAPNKRVSLTFEALKPGTDFSSQAMEVLDGTQNQGVGGTGILPGGSGGRSVPLLSQLLEGNCIHWLTAPSSVSEPAMAG